MHTIITTISKPTSSVISLNNELVRQNGRLIIIGDKKSPVDYNLKGVEYYTINKQIELPFTIKNKLPYNHYSRKNLGYLISISKGNSIIFETDDDNTVNGKWIIRKKETEALEVKNNGWVNIYRHFSDDHLIWPRGFPLDKINDENSIPKTGLKKRVSAPVQQGLANGSPDVDGLWRLLLGREFMFEDRESIMLTAGAWCPFNSQSTWWWQEAFPLMYLPSYCSFRMTDIWRSFIAQRCLWEMGYMLVFHPPEVYQDRNEHDLMKDFEAEIPGYIGNDRFVKILEDLALKAENENALDNQLKCYEALVKAGFFPETELELVSAWTDDVAELLYKKLDSLD